MKLSEASALAARVRSAQLDFIAATTCSSCHQRTVRLEAAAREIGVSLSTIHRLLRGEFTSDYCLDAIEKWSKEHMDDW